VIFQPSLSANVRRLRTLVLKTLWTDYGLKRNVSARNTLPSDVYGIPTISIPCGFTSAGLPIGLQIAGAPWAEPAFFALAHAYEQATQWHTRHPKLG
jgi:Asp-tRNA(Asn)/Glu-tRNA(Gln) amidotransferase A subunit family amidase